MTSVDMMLLLFVGASFHGRIVRVLCTGQTFVVRPACGVVKVLSLMIVSSCRSS